MMRHRLAWIGIAGCGQAVTRRLLARKPNLERSIGLVEPDSAPTILETEGS